MCIVRVHDLNYTYLDGPQALFDVRFAVKPGESVGLVGPNGAGKTTLFLCLSGVFAPRSGSIHVADLDPSQRSNRRALAGKIGIVFQDSDDQIFNASVFDDVAFGPLNLDLRKDDVRQRVKEALHQVGLSGFDERVPFQLSGGEKRRVALAGVLAMRPEVLLLDEPSMYLDPRGRRELIVLINQLAVTKIIAAHDLDLILDTCRRTLVLDQGRLIADGPTEMLLADDDLMEAHGLEVPYRLRSG